MRIHLGLAIQDSVLPASPQLAVGEIYCGPRQLLLWLEDHLGLRQPEENVEHLRIEQYRQALTFYLQTHPEAFFAASFVADDMGTAASLLERRDELLMAGCNLLDETFKTDRLQAIAAIELLLSAKDNALQLLPGRADRSLAVLAAGARIPRFLQSLHLCDERSLFPPFWQRFFAVLAEAGLPIENMADYPGPELTTDLGQWQAFLRGDVEKAAPLRGDGSLLLLKGFRETHLAAYLARLLHENNSYRPSLLLPQANRTLDNALTLEGLPSLGVPSASLARPSLQVLKLAPVFLWQPVDLYKIMEFVSLAVKPLDAGLGQRIAAFLADTPGLFSGRWYGMIRDYFDRELPQRLGPKGGNKIAAIRAEYEFWFNRQRADSRLEKVPKEDIVAIYTHLQNWAANLGKEDGATTLLVLAAQAKRIVERLGYLELERIVRTIYEPAPLQYQAAEAEHLPLVHQPGAIVGPVEQLVWWDFFEREPDYFFSRWYPAELQELADAGVQMEGPDQQNTRLVAQRKRPLLWAKKQLVLCHPDHSEGQGVTPHPLLGDLTAAFGEDELARITLHLDKNELAEAWSKTFRLPEFTQLPPKPLAPPVPFLQIGQPLLGRETETPTSLERLLYYPYQWVFRHHIKLRQSSILSVVQDTRLLGNLAHRLLEKLLEQNFTSWSKAKLEDWVGQEVPQLLEKEGATLLLYGREPERIAFTKQMKYAAWSLIDLLKANDWEVVATEAELEGEVANIPLKGRADLVLGRGEERAIVDLKWRGKTRYTNMLSSGEDIQLALYAKLLPPTEQWAHTAYFIIDKGRLLVRNTSAFKGVQPVQDEVDHEEVYATLLEKISATYQWRLLQLKRGELEIRCEATQLELEETYGEALLDLLEMKTTNAYFDDYACLVGLIH
jgi:RecB family exonuclease